MSKQDTIHYLGILAICAGLIVSMLYAQKHIDSMADTYYLQKHATIDSRPLKTDNVKPVRKVK